MNRLAIHPMTTASLIISVLAGMLLAGRPARATTMTYGTGLANPALTIDFAGQSEGAAVGATYAGQGVTFGGLFITSQYGSTLAGTSAPAARNFNGLGIVNSTFSISFSTVMADAAFFLATDGFGATVTSTLAGAAVETLSVGGYQSNGQDYFGFTGSGFDGITIVVAGSGTAVIDNVELGALATVPEPGSSGLVIAGLAGLGLLGRRRRA